MDSGQVPIASSPCASHCTIKEGRRSNFVRPDAETNRKALPLMRDALYIHIYIHSTIEQSTMKRNIVTSITNGLGGRQKEKKNTVGIIGGMIVITRL